MSRPPSKPKSSASISPELLEEEVADHLVNAGVSPDVAKAIAEGSVIVICSIFSGSQVYFPQSLLNRYRDRLIYQLTDGHNTNAIASEFSLTPRRIRQIVHKSRKAKGRL